MVRIWSLLNLRSSHKASSSSWTLRLTVLAGVRNRFFAVCWVMVEPPWTMRPAARLAAMARPRPIISIPK